MEFVPVWDECLYWTGPPPLFRTPTVDALYRIFVKRPIADIVIFTAITDWKCGYWFNIGVYGRKTELSAAVR